jgi:hypothetical protein
MSTKPRGYRSAKMPRDPARLLRALRACRDEMLAAANEVHFTCDLQKAGHRLTEAICGVAAVLTGESMYFAEQGGGATEGQKEHRRRWGLIERGDLPWPR